MSVLNSNETPENYRLRNTKALIHFREFLLNEKQGSVHQTVEMCTTVLYYSIILFCNHTDS